MTVVMVGKILEPVAMPTGVGLQHHMRLSTEGLKVMGDFQEETKFEKKKIL